MRSAPPILATVSQAYSDAVSALRAMPFLALIAFAVSLGQSIIEAAVVPPVAEARTILDEIIALFLGAVWSFLFASFLIAVHRYVLLGEVTAAYRLETGNPRFMRFFFWSFLLFAMFSLISIISTLFGPENAAGAIIAIAGMIAAVVIGIRLVILFPAIAVDARNATFDNAFADSKGHMLRIVGMLFVAALPALAAVIITTLFFLGAVARPGGAFNVVGSLFFSASSVFFGAVFVAVASRLYMALGERLR